jgi:signal transduction histidine kinase
VSPSDAAPPSPTPAGRGDRSDRQQAQVLFGAVRIVLGFFVLLVAALWLPGVSSRAAISTAVLAAAALPFLLALALSRAGHQLLAERIAVTNLTLGAMVSVASFGGLHGPIVYALPLSIAVVGLLRGQRAAILAGVAEVAFAIVESQLERAGLAPFVAPLLGSPATLVGVVGGVAMAVALITMYLREVAAARRQASQSAARALASEHELREARRLEGLGRLAGGVAHDFRNLLTPILVNAEVLERERSLSPQGRELVGEIALAGERANALTQQLLAFARRQDLQLRPIDLNRVILGIEPLLRRLVPADIQLRVALAHEACTLEGDRTQLEQVIVNLVANARDALRGSGTIRIGTGEAFLAPADAARHPARPAGRCVALSVADDGVGMTEEVRARLFEPFFSTKGPDRGTGLGLATVHGVVSQLGGAIEVESSPGAGTTFRILLPRLDAPGERVAARTPAPTPAPATADRGVRILVLDDDDLVRGAVARTLRRAGHDVAEASAGGEAIDLARRAGSPFDLLVTDLVMPLQTGNEVARELQRLRACRRVLFISGHAEHPALRDARALPDSAFLQKPFSRAALLASVSTLLVA